TANAAAVGDNCSENEIFTAGKGGATTQFPAPGVPVHAGDNIGVYYNDESEMNTVPPLTLVFEVDGTQVTPVVETGAAAAQFAHLNKFVSKISYTIPANTAPGHHTVMARAWDSDQNKPGGDCGTANWSFDVAQPPTTTTMPPTTTTMPPTTTTTAPPTVDLS